MESVYRLKPYRGFESPSLRQFFSPRPLKHSVKNGVRENPQRAHFVEQSACPPVIKGSTAWSEIYVADLELLDLDLDLDLLQKIIFE